MPYENLTQEHKRVRENRAREVESYEVSRARAEPRHEAGKAPAVVRGNDWVARDRATALIRHNTLYGAWPQMTPTGPSTGTVLSPQAQRMLNQAVARVRAAGVEQGAPTTDTPAAKETPNASNALRVGVAALWEKRQDHLQKTVDQPSRKYSGPTVDVVAAPTVGKPLPPRKSIGAEAASGVRAPSNRQMEVEMAAAKNAKGISGLWDQAKASATKDTLALSLDDD